MTLRGISTSIHEDLAAYHLNSDEVSSVLEREDAQEAATMKSLPKATQVLNDELRSMVRDLRQS
eukprot:5894751-Amphidinium_carterae.1